MRLSILALALLIASCIPMGTYKYGTEVTAAQQSQIKPGMTMADVRDILGQPDSVTDNLNEKSKRWVYGQSTVKDGGSTFKMYTVDFTPGGKVVIDGDDGSKK